ncbi:MAG: hypothetical protein RLZZ28_342 [Bacteroidota bacterium]
MIREWLNNKPDFQKIRKELADQGLDEETITGYIQTFNKIKRDKTRFTGFLILGLGAFLGFISCMLSVTNPIPALYYWILYGLTSLAIVIIFVGLYIVLEG